MLRPRPVRKGGFCCWVSWYGHQWKIVRPQRHRPAIVADWVYQPVLFGTRARGRRLAGELSVLKPSGPVSRGTCKLATDDVGAFRELPHLRGFFLNQVYDDGESVRQPGLLILKATSDGWQWTLKEVTACLMLRFSSRTLDEGWALAEGFLGNPHAPWETDPYESAKRSRSRKPKA